MGVKSAPLRESCATSQPGPQRPAFLQRIFSCSLLSDTKCALHDRFKSASNRIFHSKHFVEVAPVCLFLLTNVRHGICSKKREVRVSPPTLLNSGPVQTRINSTASPTRPLAFANHARPFQSVLSPSSPQPNGAEPDKQLCPVCEIISSEPCSCCAQDFCGNHIYSCIECDAKYCSICFDAHHADGHWGDSDTAAEQARSQYIGDRQVRCQPDLSPAVYTGCNHSNGRSPGTTLLKSFRSFLVLVFRRCVVVQQEACL